MVQLATLAQDLAVAPLCSQLRNRSSPGVSINIELRGQGDIDHVRKVRVGPRTHHLCALTCGYVVGSDLVGFRSRNDNDSGKASLRLRGTCPERGSGTLNQPARRGPTSRLRRSIRPLARSYDAAAATPITPGAVTT